MRLNVLKPLAVGILSMTGAITAAEQTTNLLSSRERAAGFLSELRARLQAAMAESPIKAISVCQDEAPEIAQRWSSDGYWVRRSSLRVRNSGNAPTERDLTTMAHFSARVLAGEPASSIEEFEVYGEGQSRYARALVMEPACLICHGEKIAPAITTVLNQRYPDDRATGFDLGGLRGIVVVELRAP